MTRDHAIRIVAIDGPAGAGKSTVAKRLAAKLNLSYLDTGAMYRALTLKAVLNYVNLEDEEALVKMAQQTTVDLEDHASVMKVLLDGRDVSDDIRTSEITNKTFYLARAPRVRAVMVQWQRAIAGKKGVVAEGRDIGTVVFPQAAHKFYLDADVQERSRRRMKDLRERGEEVDADKLTAEMIARDNHDFTRSIGPLKKADDAILIDTTDLTIDGVVEEILKYIQEIS